MTIQWFPGHMARAKRIIEEDLKIVDGVLEIADARVPFSSRNPDLKELSAKPQIVVLAKTDLADAQETKNWLNFWRAKDERIVAVNLLDPSALGELRQLVQTTFTNLKRKPRLLVVGIPNVGKSTLINRFTKRRAAPVGARPGITRGRQWLNAPGLILLDSPGILWPKFSDQETAKKLAAVASIRDEVFDQTEVAHWLLQFLAQHYPHGLTKRYGNFDPINPLEAVGQKRGCLLPGGIVDLNKAAMVVLKDFRWGKLGAVTLDKCETNGGWPCVD